MINSSIGTKCNRKRNSKIIELYYWKLLRYYYRNWYRKQCSVNWSISVHCLYMKTWEIIVIDGKWIDLLIIILLIHCHFEILKHFWLSMPIFYRNLNRFNLHWLILVPKWGVAANRRYRNEDQRQFDDMFRSPNFIQLISNFNYKRLNAIALIWKPKLRICKNKKWKTTERNNS